jgi:hypothetical protein
MVRSRADRGGDQPRVPHCRCQDRTSCFCPCILRSSLANKTDTCDGRWMRPLYQPLKSAIALSKRVGGVLIKRAHRPTNTAAAIDEQTTHTCFMAVHSLGGDAPVSCMAGHHALAFVHTHNAWRQRANYQWPKPSLRHAFPIFYHRGESLLFGHLGAHETGEDSPCTQLCNFCELQNSSCVACSSMQDMQVSSPHTAHVPADQKNTVPTTRLHDCSNANAARDSATRASFLTSLARLRGPRRHKKTCRGIQEVVNFEASSQLSLTDRAVHATGPRPCPATIHHPRAAVGSARHHADRWD